MSNKEDIKLGYFLGSRDMLAMVLAETYQKIRLPDQANWYLRDYGEQHFSHKWHVEKI